MALLLLKDTAGWPLAEMLALYVSDCGDYLIQTNK